MSITQITQLTVIALVLLFTSDISSVSADIMPSHCMDPGFDREAPVDIEKLKQLRVGQSEDSVCSILGEPNYVCGSGIQHDVYVLPDKGELWLSYEKGSLSWGFTRNAALEFYLGDGNTRK